MAEVPRAAAKDMVAVVLAAGRGTRMGKLTEALPKPLVQVLGKPALHWVLDGLVFSGVRRFVIVTGYLSSMVRDAIAGYGSENVDIAFVQQDEQLGTGHAVGLTRTAVNGAPVLLSFADIMTSPDNFESMIRRFSECSCDLVAGIRDAGDPWRAAAVYLQEDNSISRIIEKPEKGTSTTRWSHAGTYCFSNIIYDYVDRLQPSGRGEYEITDAVQSMTSEGRPAQAVEMTGYWKDLATPEDIVAAEKLMAAEPAESHVL